MSIFSIPRRINGCGGLPISMTVCGESSSKPKMGTGWGWSTLEASGSLGVSLWEIRTVIQVQNGINTKFW